MTTEQLELARMLHKTASDLYVNEVNKNISVNKETMEKCIFRAIEFMDVLKQMTDEK